MPSGVTQPPKERINIKFKAATGGATAEVELPLKMLFIGDYTGRKDERLLGERTAVNVDKNNFEEVLSKHAPSLDIHVSDKLSGQEGAELGVKLTFKKLTDFTPDQLAQQVPELRKLLELREALSALKAQFLDERRRREIEKLLGDPHKLGRLLGELGVGPNEGDSTDRKLSPPAGA
jgi:type VI secretion system protein ImpB